MRFVNNFSTRGAPACCAASVHLENCHVGVTARTSPGAILSAPARQHLPNTLEALATACVRACVCVRAVCVRACGVKARARRAAARAEGGVRATRSASSEKRGKRGWGGG